MPADALLYTTTSISCISFISGLALLLAYMKLPKLRKRPGMLVLYQGLAQAITDLNWVATGIYIMITGYGISRFPESGYLCRVHGLVSSYSFFLSLNYIFCLSVELMHKLRSPMNNSHKKRFVLMHAISHSMCIIIVILLGVLGGSGESALGSCFIQANTWGDYLLFLPICVYCPFSMGVVVFALASYQRTKRLKRSGFLVRFSLVILMYEVCWTPLSILHVMDVGKDHHNANIFEGTAWVMSSLGGLVVNTIRLSDSAIRSTLKRRRVIRLSMPSLNNSFSSISDPEIFKFYQDVQLEGVTSVYLGLALVFRMVENYPLVQNKAKTVCEQSMDKRTFLISPSIVSSADFLDDRTKRHCKSYLVRHYEAKITEYAPQLFSILRSLEGIHTWELFEAFNPVANRTSIRTNTGNKGGRSDAFLSFSADKKFVIKTITKGELEFLLEAFLSAYYEHVTVKESLLARILGLFSFADFAGGECIILVMMNIIGSPDSVSTLFDLKGSKVARKTLKDLSVTNLSQLPKGGIYKDVDFLQVVGRIDLDPEDEEMLMCALEGDLDLLTRLNVMDYSLLVAFVPCASESFPLRCAKYRFLGSGCHAHYCFYIGLIDYLQEYTTLKRLETFGKRMVSGQNAGTGISIVSPGEYSTRMLAFVGKIAGLDQPFSPSLNPVD